MSEIIRCNISPLLASPLYPFSIVGSSLSVQSFARSIEIYPIFTDLCPQRGLYCTSIDGLKKAIYSEQKFYFLIFSRSLASLIIYFCIVSHLRRLRINFTSRDKISRRNGGMMDLIIYEFYIFHLT